MIILVSRTDAAKAAIIEIENAVKDLAAAKRKLQTASNRLKKLYVDNGVDLRGAQHFEAARYRLAESSVVIDGVEATLRSTAAIRGLALSNLAGDTRKFPDERRDKVLSAIMTFWHEMGRKLTYTTDWSTSERWGVLIDFVNAVVACVSDPPGALSGEAIIAGIKAGKKMSILVASVLEEMKKAKLST